MVSIHLDKDLENGADIKTYDMYDNWNYKNESSKILNKFLDNNNEIESMMIDKNLRLTLGQSDDYRIESDFSRNRLDNETRATNMSGNVTNTLTSQRFQTMCLLFNHLESTMVIKLDNRASTMTSRDDINERTMSEYQQRTNRSGGSVNRKEKSNEPAVTGILIFVNFLLPPSPSPMQL